MKDKPIYFVDVETSGLDFSKDCIIEFCVIKKTKYQTTSIWKRVSPADIPIHPKAQEVNGYTEDKWKHAVTQAKAAELISGFMMERGVICGHNVSFDTEFLSRLLLRHGYACLPRRKIDTYTLAYEHLVPMGLKSLGFDEIRRFMGWKVHKHHDAKTDAFDVLRLYNNISGMGIIKKTYVWCRSIPYRMRGHNE